MGSDADCCYYHAHRHTIIVTHAVRHAVAIGHLFRHTIVVTHALRHGVVVTVTVRHSNTVDYWYAIKNPNLDAFGHQDIFTNWHGDVYQDAPHHAIQKWDVLHHTL